MIEKNNNSLNITQQIYNNIFEILNRHPKGIHWNDLLIETKKSNSNFHPKTVNGCIWKITNKYPDRVFKPSRGIFKLIKYK